MRPSARKVSTMRRVVALIGTASPSPTPATRVTTPITLPRESAGAPPQFPGTEAASVWMTSSMTRPARREDTGTARPSALTTPAVTDPAKPSGLPTATTSTRMRAPYRGHAEFDSGTDEFEASPP